MKQQLLFWITFFGISFSYLTAQSNYEIANVYFKKAEQSIEKIDYKTAQVHFDKGIAKLDSIQKARIAELGTFIYYELKKYEEAKLYAKQYFTLSRSKSSESYKQMLELYVEIEEKIAEIEEENEKAELLRLKRARELKKKDSLTKIWNTLAETFTIKADTIHEFNTYGFAIFKKEGSYGLINDNGKIIIQPKKYKKANEFEGFFIFSNKKNKASELYCYNAKEKAGFELPDIKDVNKESTYYEKVMLPRGNNKLVAYLNNSLKTMVFDLEQERFMKIKNLEELLKKMKKADVIDKYDEDERTVKVNKVWYGFGNHLGGEVYSIYDLETKKIKGYLFSATDAEDLGIATVDDIGYLGYLHRNKMQALRNKENHWYNSVGDKVSRLSNSTETYEKGIEIKKISDNEYQFLKDGIVTFKGKKLPTLIDFLKRSK